MKWNLPPENRWHRDMNLQRFILIGGADSNAWDYKMFANLIEMNLYRFFSLMHVIRG